MILLHDKEFNKQNFHIEEHLNFNKLRNSFVRQIPLLMLVGELLEVLCDGEAYG